MLLSVSNAPRDYAWGSTTLIAELEGRPATGAPEAEVWLGDHPGDPADVADGTGRTLDRWLQDEGRGALPYLLKLLAAASPLSIQAHPSKEQAEIGWARELALSLDDPARNYRDDNHKPELVVAISERFQALSGLRPLDHTRAYIGALPGEGAAELRRRLEGDDHTTILRDAIAWLLSGEAQNVVDDVIRAVETTEPEGELARFAAELAAARRIAGFYPGDPGVVVAMLMNYVELERGQGVFLRAGLIHAYLDGLGVELMAASDNVLRGGLTPKRIDVDELMTVLDTTPAPAGILLGSAVAPHVVSYGPGIADFELLRVEVDAVTAEVSLRGTAILVATAGAVTVSDGGAEVTLRPGQAVLADRTSRVSVSGTGELFVAQPGA